MFGSRALAYALGALLSVAAILTGLGVASNCDAPDWAQLAMLTLLPAAAAVGAAVAVGSWIRSRFVAVPVGLGVGAASWFASAIVFIGCST